MLALYGFVGCAHVTSESPLVVRAQSPSMTTGPMTPGYDTGRPGQRTQDPDQPPQRKGPAQATSLEARPILLRDAIAMALARSDIVRVLNGGVQIAGTTTYDPQIAESQLTGQYGAFDPRFRAAYEGSQIDQPPSSFFGPGIETETRRDEADFSAELSRKWAAGTSTSFGYAPPLAYLFFPRGLNGSLNPSHSAEFLVKVEQPLLRGAWSEINLAPIHIAQTRIDQSRWDVQQAIQQQVRSVEEAYWQLNAAYVELQAIENVIPLAEESVRIESLRMQAEQSIYSDVARAEVQLEQLRQQYLDAWLSARRREFQLRQLIGLDARDDNELLPADAPRQTPPAFDFDQIVAVALQERPDINKRRLGLQIREQELLLAQNRVKPELNVSASYRVAGLSERVDRAFDQIGGFDFEDWTVGMTFDVPLNNRTAKSAREVSSLRLMRDRAVLAAYEKQIVFDLAELTSEVISAWRQYESSHRQLTHTAQWLRVARVRYANPPDAGDRQDWLLLALRDYQSAIDAHVRAVSGAGRSLARYNVLLARLAEAQGSNLERWSIQLQGTTFTPPNPAQAAIPGYVSTTSVTPVTLAAGSPEPPALMTPESATHVSNGPSQRAGRLLPGHAEIRPVAAQFPN